MIDNIVALSWALDSCLLNELDGFPAMTLREKPESRHLRIWVPPTDDDFTQRLAEHIKSNASSIAQTTSSREVALFENTFRHWINNSAIEVIGLENFEPTACASMAALDGFIFRHRDRRFRLYSGEYHALQLDLTLKGLNWSFATDEDPLAPGDVLMLSQPHFGTGNVFRDLDTVLMACDTLSIPVAIDCCLVVTMDAGTINLNFDCVEEVYFSLSKMLPITHIKAGVRYSKKGIYDTAHYLSRTGYFPALSAKIANFILSNYSVDYYGSKHRQKQLAICASASGLTPSDSVLSVVGDYRYRWINKDISFHSPSPYGEMLDERVRDTCPPNKLTLSTAFQYWDELTSAPSGLNMQDLSRYYLSLLWLRNSNKG